MKKEVQGRVWTRSWRDPKTISSPVKKTRHQYSRHRADDNVKIERSVSDFNIDLEYCIIMKLFDCRVPNLRKWRYKSSFLICQRWFLQSSSSDVQIMEPIRMTWEHNQFNILTLREIMNRSPGIFHSMHHEFSPSWGYISSVDNTCSYRIAAKRTTTSPIHALYQVSWLLCSEASCISTSTLQIISLDNLHLSLSSYFLVCDYFLFTLLYRIE